MFQKLNYASLNDIVYEEIKQKIILNELKPNEKLDVDFLSNSLGVSRTPVTNALKSLCREGYVIINPRSGSYVRELNREEIRCLFDFRLCLEEQVIREITGKPELTDAAELQEYEREFRRLAELPFGQSPEEREELMRRFFDAELKFHEYLVAQCPSIIGDKIKNMIDLTKRIRIRHTAYKLEAMDAEQFRREAELHLQLLRAVRDGDLQGALDTIHQDIGNTRDEIMECFDAING